MGTATVLTDDDLDALVWLIDTWGNVMWADGFAAPRDATNPDHFAVAAGQQARMVDANRLRDDARRRLFELAGDCQISETKMSAVLEGVEAWAEHRFQLGQVTWYAIVHKTESLKDWKRTEENTGRQLRQTWINPLVRLVDSGART